MPPPYRKLDGIEMPTWLLSGGQLIHRIIPNLLFEEVVDPGDRPGCLRVQFNDTARRVWHYSATIIWTQRSYVMPERIVMILLTM